MNLKSNYYAVIFTSKQTPNTDGYKEMSDKMIQLARTQAGFIGLDSARSEVGITVSYWESLDAIAKWKNNLEHKEVQKMGRTQWYAFYDIKICQVIREYSFENKN